MSTPFHKLFNQKCGGSGIPDGATCHVGMGARHSPMDNEDQELAIDRHEQDANSSTGARKAAHQKSVQAFKYTMSLPQHPSDEQHEKANKLHQQAFDAHHKYEPKSHAERLDQKQSADNHYEMLRFHG